jgi:molybdopterin-guanine dinucleotide biosynthesis protein A
MTFLPGTKPLPPSAEVTGAILAGGSSRRLGRDKVTLELGGKPLAHWVADTLMPLVAELWLVTNHPREHAGLHLPMFTDLVPFQGPLGGLATALFYARTPWVLLTAADTPFLSPSLAAALVGAAGKIKRPALVCRTERGIEPLPGLYAVRILSRLEDLLKTTRRAFMALLDPLRPEVWGPEVWRTFDPEGASFLNLNRQEDLARLEGWMAGRQGSLQPAAGGDQEKLNAPDLNYPIDRVRRLR